MATLENRDIILHLLQNKGVYFDDPQAFVICQYRLKDSETTLYHVSYNHLDFHELMQSRLLEDLVILWLKSMGLTHFGKGFIGTWKK